MEQNSIKRFTMVGVDFPARQSLKVTVLFNESQGPFRIQKVEQNPKFSYPT
jgi:hypothetical protein